ncbi:MAG: translocation/assembly module TamB domain-containing protein [Pseudomonadota bacterium]
MRSSLKKWLVGAATLASVGLLVNFAGAQDAEKSRFVRFVENQLSTPDRQIRIGGIEGVLSSDVRFQSFTIADREGVWLTVEDVELEWSRFALLRGRLDVDRLVAESIIITRAPVPAEDDGAEADKAADGEFQLPELPVSVMIDDLTVDTVSVAQGLMGPAFQVGLQGRANLSDGALDAAISVDRQDRPGTLSLEAAFNNDSRQLTVNADIAEPPNGVVANALSIEGRPSVDLRVAGDGPLSDFSADVRLSANGDETLSGTVRIDDDLGALEVSGDLSGDFRSLVAQRFQPLVDGGSQLSFVAARETNGGFTLDRFSLRSGAAEVSIAGQLAPDFVPLNLSINAVLARPDGSSTPLIGVDDGTVERIAITGALGGTLGEAYQLNVEVSGLNTPFLVADSATLRASGAAEALRDPDARRVTFTVEGDAGGLEQSGSGVADAIGDAFSLRASGSWSAGDPVNVERADLRATTFATRFAGTIADGLDGSYQLRADNLSAFSSLAGRTLAGTISLDAAGSVGFDGLFDLRFDGAAQDLAFGTPADGLLAGRLQLGGRATRSAQGLSFDAFRLTGDSISMTANGALTTGEANLRAAVQLANVGDLREGVSGPLTVQLSATGAAASPDISVSVGSDRLTVGPRDIDDLLLAFNGDWQRDQPELSLTGDLSLTARVDDTPARLLAGFELAGSRYALSGLDAEVAGAVLRGDLTSTDGLLTGDLAARVPDLGTLAALALLEAAGSLDADLSFSVDGDAQRLGAVGQAREIAVAGSSIGFAAFDLTVDHLFDVPLADGTADLRAATVAGFDIRTLSLRAHRDGEASQLTVRGDVTGATVSAETRWRRETDGFAADVQALSITKDGEGVTLEAPTTISARDGEIFVDETLLSLGAGTVQVAGEFGDTINVTADFDAASLTVANLIRPDLQLRGIIDGEVTARGTADQLTGDVGLTLSGLTAAELSDRGIAPVDVRVEGSLAGDTFELRRADVALGEGTISASGDVGDTLDLTVTARDLPLGLGNIVSADLGLSGTLNADARLTGSRDAPEATFEARTQNASAATLRSAGPISATVAGRFASGTIILSSAKASIAGGRIDASGRVGNTMDLSAVLTSVPLALADAFAPSLALRGNLSGRVDVAGTLASPRVDFRLNSSGVSAAPTEMAGIGPLSVTADGSFARNVVTLTRADVSGSDLSVNASGRVPLSGAGMRLTVRADAPLSLANRVLAERGGAVTGDARADVTVTGSLSRPQVRGTASANGFTLRDPSTGVVLQNGSASAQFTGETVILRSLRAELGGGIVSASGRIGLGSGQPVDLTLRFDNTRYADGRLVAVTFDGTQRVTGSLSAPKISGRIDIQRAEITVPETLPGTGTLINLKHMGLPVDVAETLRRARAGPYAEQPDEGTSRAGGPTLDVTISAPARVFIRGRGIDAEVGGQLVVRGPVHDVQPVGRFELIRGRLSMLGQRIEFTEGSVTLFGDLDPEIRLVAEKRRTDVIVSIIVAGLASNPTVTVESTPALPQDEALAQLLFGRSINDLSPFQLAQLAASVAELAGSGGGPGLLDQLRVFAGLDDLEIVTDEEGSPAAQVGTYIADNIYLGVRAGEKSSGVTVNIDLVQGLTVRAEALTDRESIGIFYEREY